MPPYCHGGDLLEEVYIGVQVRPFLAPIVVLFELMYVLLKALDLV